MLLFLYYLTVTNEDLNIKVLIPVFKTMNSILQNKIDISSFESFECFETLQRFAFENLKISFEFIFNTNHCN